MDDNTSSPNDHSGLFQSRYREITISAVLLGLLIGAIMNVAITYSGLKIGFTIGGSAIAAVLGFGVLRGILRKGSILETNISQTVASGVNIPNSGIIFTVPVLFLLGFEMTSQRFWLITLAGVIGAVLGVGFIIPLRKQMIDIDRLRFPTAVAVGAILKSPGAGPKKAVVLVIGIVVAMLIYLPVGLPSIEWTDAQGQEWRGAGYGDLNLTVADRDGDGDRDAVVTHSTIDVGRMINLPGQMELIFAIAPFALGAGYLTGRAGLLVLAGGVLAYFILNPIAYAAGWMPETLTPYEVPHFAHGEFNRPLGIGMLLGGALIGILASFPAIKEAIKSIARVGMARTGADELGLKVVGIAVAVAAVFLFIAAELIGFDPGAEGWLKHFDPHVRNLIIALVGVVWMWFAGIIIAQCTGMTDWSPISGMALLTVLMVLLLAGTTEVLGAVLIGAALCVATTSASDMMQDLKTGYMVGAQPRRQQVLELSIVFLGPVISMATLLIIVEANMTKFGAPIGAGTDTPAPQANALKAVIEGIQGGEMPYALYIFGAGLGVLLGIGAFPSLGVLVGLSMYLPIMYILTYGVGCLINIGIGRVKGRVWAEEWGVPFCAGLIVGEAILSVILNIVVLILGN